MKDRNAWVENKVTRGVDPTEAMTQRAFGVPAGAHPGLVEAPPQFKGLPEGEAKGLMENNYGFTPKPKPRVCAATTKKGLPCKAAPVAGEKLCVGHGRQ